MSELGSYLKQEREMKKISLEELHEETKIRQLYLEAIENGEFNVLPGEVYLKGFLRTISRELSLDYAHVLELYRKDAGVAHEDIPLSQPDSILREVEQENRTQRRTIILIGGLLLLGGVAIALMLMYS